jgi:F0F1-type ATP synthase membrane subunit b/b'
MAYEHERDVETLLERVRSQVEGARPMPLSASVLVNREELLELLEEAIARLPEELRRARWLLKEREEFLAKARREGEEIVEAARTRAERLVQRTEIVREAEATARRIVEDAEAESRALKHEAEDYIDRKLAQFEVVLDRTLQEITRGRERLQVVVEPLADQEVGDLFEDEMPVFDQDEM